jgi:mRNA-degrading endonuclease YafQ of YafQ-DinJ toxin-antitoxin module
VIRIHWDDSFRRSYRRRIKGNPDLERHFRQSVELFAAHPHHPRLRTHKLSGTLKDLWAFSCGYDCRVVFTFLAERTVLLIDIGSHDEVY